MNETLLNKARLNVVSLNKALINGSAERHGSSAGGGGAPSKYIRFADPAVEAVLMANGVSSDGVGITKEDAAAVTSIGTWFKGNTEITSFNEFKYFTGVTGLERTAFQDCSSLESIYTQNLTTLGAACFERCISLVSVNLSNVISIGGYAFSHCESMKVDIVAPKLTTLSDANTFSYSGVTGFEAPLITSVVRQAFDHCYSLAYIKLDNVTRISSGAFYGCSSLVGDVVLPNLTYAEYDAFYGTAISSFVADSLPSIPQSMFNSCPKLKNVSCASAKTVGVQSFKECTSLVSVNIPICTSIGVEAFVRSNSLENVTLSEDVTTISRGAFSGCTSLMGDMVFNKLTSLGEYIFEGSKITSLVSKSVPKIVTRACKDCSALKLVELEAATEIGYESFVRCYSLETVIVRNITPPTLNSSAFGNTNSTFLIYVPDAALEVYKTATNWSAYADRIHPLSELEGSPYIQFADAEVERVLMENNVSSDGVGITMADAEAVTSIGTWFKGNTAIQSFDELQYFTGVTKLGVKYNYDGSSAAFSGCSNLASVVLPASIKVIGNSAFKGCSSLQNINIPSTITELDASAFEGCAFELNDLYLPNLTLFNIKVFHGGPKIRKISNLGSITSLPDAGWGVNANYGDKSFLDEITLPATMTNIVQASFYNYIALHTVVCLAETPPSLANTNVFDGCPLNNGIYVPDASVDAYKAATNWSTYADRIKPLLEYYNPNGVIIEHGVSLQNDGTLIENSGKL